MRTKAETGKDLYIIVSKVTGSIKIGRTSNIEQRLTTLRTGNAYPLKLILLLENQGKEEKYYHKLCRKYRLEGEWFSLDSLAAALPFNVYEQIDLDALYDFIGS